VVKKAEVTGVNDCICPNMVGQFFDDAELSVSVTYE